MNATLSARRTIRISNGSPERMTITVEAGRAGAIWGELIALLG
jgi:hypothetical protein